MWRFFKRFCLTLIISTVAIIGICVSLVFIYEEEVVSLIIKELNKHLKTEIRIDPKNINLTIIKSFPNCSIEFKQLTAMDAAEFKGTDTLLWANRLALEFNIKDLFNKNYTIKKIELEQATCHLKIDKRGNANYSVWKSETNAASNDSVKFALENISLNDVELSLKDSKHKIKLQTSIKALHFTGKFNEANYTLISEGAAYVHSLQVENMKYLNNKQLKFDIVFDVQKSMYAIKKSEVFINKTEIVSQGQFVVRDSLQSLDLNFNGKNLDISTTLSLLPEKFQTQINDYKSDGEFYASGECHYKAASPFALKADFGIKKANIIYKKKNTTLSHVNLLGTIIINENRSNLTLKNISANLNSNTFKGDIEITNFRDPYLKLKLEANTKLEELIAFYPIDTLQTLSGKVVLQTEIEGLISEMTSNAFSPNIKANGKVETTDLKIMFKHTDKIINIPEGKFELNNRHLNIYHLNLIKGNSDVMLVGELPNFLNYLFNPKEPLTIIAKVMSDKIELEDFIFASGKSTENASINIPSNLDFNISINVSHLTFAKFVAENVKGNILLQHQKIALKEVVLHAMDGEVKLNAFADATGDNFRVSADCELNKLNIQKAFTQLNNFGQSTLKDNNLKGFVTASVDFSGAWDKQLQVDLNSINTTSSILMERGELIGFKPLESLAKYIDVNELKHIKFSTLQSAVEIKNKIITIPKTSIKSTAINLELWGKHSFDNIIDYHIQLLLSEVLAKKPRANKAFDEELSLIENDSENRRSVFILMTGPIDNPIIKYDKKGAGVKIKDDIKQEKQNLKQLLKEEFGFFKKDSISRKKEEVKTNPSFQIDIGDKDPKKAKPLQPKKKEDEEDF